MPRASAAAPATRRDLRKEFLLREGFDFWTRARADAHRAADYQQHVNDEKVSLLPSRFDARDTPSIPAPPFPRRPWVNVATLRMDQQRGKAVLVEFWDFCRVNSLRTLPYLKAWHERYAEAGLRIIGVHTGGFLPGARRGNVRRAVERLEIPWAVLIDTELEVWDIYGNQGWPARYLWDPDAGAALAALRRGRLRGDRARDPVAARRDARAARADAARGRAGRADRAADRGPAGRVLAARTRRAACGRSSRARASCASTGACRGAPSRAACALVEHGATRGELRSRRATA